MPLDSLHPHQLAQTWAERVQQRMTQAGASPDDIREVVYVVPRLVPIAVENLRKDPKLALPNTTQTAPLDEERAMLILELFVRGISQMMKHLREVEHPKPLTWHERLAIMEQAAFEGLTVARVLVASYVLPGIANIALKSQSDLFVVMTQASEEVVQKHLPRGFQLKKQGGLAEKPKNLTFALTGLLAKTANPYTAPIEELPFYKAPDPEPEPELEPEVEPEQQSKRGTL